MSVENIIDQELRACTPQFKPENYSNDRKLYLKNLLYSVNKMSDKIYDTLSDRAAAWVYVNVVRESEKLQLLDFGDPFIDFANGMILAERVTRLNGFSSNTIANELDVQIKNHSTT